MSETEGKRDKWFYKSVRDLIKMIEDADLKEKLPFFNDVITGNTAVDPDQWGGTILRDVKIDGRTCDIYHTDKFTENGDTEGSGCRVYIHKKG